MKKSLYTAVALAALSLPLWAQTASAVKVSGAWVRATVQGQMATGAFMQLQSSKDTTLVGVSTPVAPVAEVHEMKMDGGVMQMRAVQGGLPLPAGKPVELKPGGYHVMLMDLKTPMKKDTTIPLTLVFKDAKGVESRTELKVPVYTQAPEGSGHSAHDDHHGKH